MKKKVGSLIYGNQFNYLDHLAPICYFLNIPLITNNEEISIAAKKYYPKVKVLFIDNLNIHFYVAKNFDIIISCITKSLFDANFKFHQDQLNKNIQIVWCPHGNSDKGKTCQFFESLLNEKLVLVYGKKMIDFLKEKKVFHTISQVIEIGNYRLEYYKKFKNFFDNILINEVLKKFKTKKKIILYAPTWKDAENSSSFEKNFEILLKTLPEKFNLIIKLHPNLIEKFNFEIEMFKLKNEKNNILFLENFSLIYPLLNVVDVYLGDFSSIGYDFLFFKKPMFFLQSENLILNSDLYKCGELIKDENIYDIIEKGIIKHKYKNQIKKMYDYTFKSYGKIQNLKNIFNN